MSRWVWIAAGCGAALAICLGVFFSLPAQTAGSGRAMRLPIDPNPLVVVTDRGERRFTIEIADDSSERSNGLMYRRDMDDSRGMLFVFEQPQAVSFWMKNTPMPLDLLFIGADGRIEDIKPGEPFSEAPIAPDQPVKFVLELKQGTATRLGIEDGDVAIHPVIGAPRADGGANLPN